jgi:benzoate-CoA ligase family protein
MTATSTVAAATFNAADYLVDRHVRDGRGQRTAVIAPNRTLSYDDLAVLVHRVAGGLRRLGIRPGDRVVFCMADDVELLSGILGAMYLGAIAVPVSTMLTAADLGTLIADSHARIVCASTEFAAQVGVAITMAPDVVHVIFDGEPTIGALPGVVVDCWDTVMSAAPVHSASQTCDDSVGLWLYTSGTTGTPKAAMHRHGSIRCVAESYGAKVLGIAPDDRCLSVAKLFFAYGLGNSCFFPLSVGASTVLERARPNPAIVAERIQTGQPTLFFGVPTFYASLVNSGLPSSTFKSVRQAVSAGEALSPVLFAQFRDRFGVEVLDGLGSTEALHIFLSNRPRQVRPGSLGTPVPGYEIQLRDDSGRIVDSAGQMGTLYVKGGSLASGYWRRPEAAGQVFHGDWLCVGDAFVRNADDTYSWLGRSGDLIKVGGIWLAPKEIEERLLQHPAVAQAAVVAAADQYGMQKPVACVVLRPGHAADTAALISWCRDGLAAFKRPRAVVFMAELPTTSSGKLRRGVLREQVADVLVNPPPQGCEHDSAATEVNRAQ